MITIPAPEIRLKFHVNPVSELSAVTPVVVAGMNYLVMQGTSGVNLGGAANVSFYTPRLEFTSTGGFYISGTAEAAWGGTRIYQITGEGLTINGMVLRHYVRNISSSADVVIKPSSQITFFSPAVRGTLVAELPKVQSSLITVDVCFGSINTKLPKVKVNLSGGFFGVSAKLPVINSIIIGYNGHNAQIDTALPRITSVLSSTGGYIGIVSAGLTLLEPSLNTVAGYIGEIEGNLTLLSVELGTSSGARGTIAASLPNILSLIDAGYGAVGTISAKLTHIINAITVLSQATTQQLTIVINTRNDAISTYENYPYNSFFELGGVYYGAGANGISQLDTQTDFDDLVPISAGISTGLMQFGEPHLKRITDAYMTLRTAGDLTITVTVDEGTPVVLAMPAQQIVDFIQRRVLIPKGLHGKSWKFEINNVNGSNFDFSHLGFNVAVSARRIGR